MRLEPTIAELAIELVNELHETEMFERISIDRDYDAGTYSVTVMRRFEYGAAEFTFEVTITEEDRMNPLFTDRMVHKICDAMTYDACRGRLLYGQSTAIKV